MQKTKVGVGVGGDVCLVNEQLVKQISIIPLLPNFAISYRRHSTTHDELCHMDYRHINGLKRIGERTNS